MQARHEPVRFIPPEEREVEIEFHLVHVSDGSARIQVRANRIGAEPAGIDIESRLDDRSHLDIARSLHLERHGIVGGLRHERLGKALGSDHARIAFIPVRSHGSLHFGREAVVSWLELEPGQGLSLALRVVGHARAQHHHFAKPTFYGREAGLNPCAARGILNRVGANDDSRHTVQFFQGVA